MVCQPEWKTDGVHLVFSGDTSGAEIETAHDLVRKHPELPAFSYVIADHLAVERFHVTVYQMLIVASNDNWMSKKNQNLKIALVSNRDEILDVLQRYAEAKVIKYNFAVGLFNTLEDARRWVSAR